MNQELYKEKLEALAEKDFENMDINFEEYVNYGLKHIGVVDPILRDDLNYPFLATVVIDRLIDNENIIGMLRTLTSDTHLFYQIDASNSDAVFTRTFSSLIITQIVEENNNNEFLSSAELNELLEKLKLYLQSEKDFRGYVTEKGWAHSAAHIADVISVLAKNEKVSIDKIMELLFIYRDIFERTDGVFTHNEDERIIRAVMNLYERSDFEEKHLIKWIKSFDKSKCTDVYPDDLYLRINSKLLLRSLYFSLLKKDNSSNLTNAVIEQLDVIN